MNKIKVNRSSIQADAVLQNILEAERRARYLTSVIRKKREKKKWTQAQLAAAIGKTPEYIDRVEKGEVNIKLKTLLNIYRKLDVELVEKGIEYVI